MGVFVHGTLAERTIKKNGLVRLPRSWSRDRPFPVHDYDGKLMTRPKQIHGTLNDTDPSALPVCRSRKSAPFGVNHDLDVLLVGANS